MDTMIYSVLRITVMILILRTLFMLFAYPKTKSFRLSKSPANKDTDAGRTVDDKVIDSAPREMVTDHHNSKEIPRHQAYILLDDKDQPLYFSTWDGRQQYVDAQAK